MHDIMSMPAVTPPSRRTTRVGGMFYQGLVSTGLQIEKFPVERHRALDHK